MLKAGNHMQKNDVTVTYYSQTKTNTRLCLYLLFFILCFGTLWWNTSVIKQSV